MKTYIDKARCPNGHSFRLARRATSAGKKVGTFCQSCGRTYQLKAGPVPVAKVRK